MTRNDSRGVPARPQRLAWAAAGTLAVTFVTGLFVEGGESRVLGALGLAFAAVGLVFAWWPMFTLRRHGLAPEGGSYMDSTVLVDRGPFGLVRHPQYLGYICFAATLMLAGQHLWVALAGFASIALFYAHALDEERDLRHRFGEAYDRYCARVPRFNLPLGIFRSLRSRRHA